MYLFHVGFEDTGDYWRSMYETETFEEDVARIWEEVKPLYQQLHYYVKTKLKNRYPDKSFPATGHLPAHILGMYDLLTNLSVLFGILSLDKYTKTTPKKR